MPLSTTMKAGLRAALAFVGIALAGCTSGSVPAPTPTPATGAGASASTPRASAPGAARQTAIRMESQTSRAATRRSRAAYTVAIPPRPISRSTR